MKTKLYHIVAMSNNGVIGIENRLPWHFSVDFKKFKEITTGNTVIMGRRTFESIGKALPDRENVVLTHTLPKAQDTEHLKFRPSLEKALETVGHDKVFIIGGESLYRQTMDRILGIYLTRIHQNFSGDAHYPEIPSSFVEVKKETLQESPKIEFIYLENKERI